MIDQRMFGAVVSGFLAVAVAQGAGRVRGGLVAFYDFTAGEGTVVEDRSGVEPAIDLRIEDPGAVEWGRGALKVKAKTLIRTDKPPKRMLETLKKSGQLTVEAWVHPARLNQSGPARIVTLSRDTSNRNLTLGQDGETFDARLRTTKTGNNGVPSLQSANQTVDTRPTHVVFTRSRSGE
ncbi:MAG: LamG-like jellyroll fold domain-containing protein, partial [Verrucomicrobiota bacterium]